VEVPDFEPGTDVSLSLDLTAQTGTAEGASDVVGWLAYDNTELINLGYWSGDSTADTYDLNGDGSTEDLILSDSVSITYTPSNEVYATATAGTSIDTLAVGTTQSLQEGSSLYLGLNVINNQDTGSIDYLTIVDVLPYEGDTTVVPDETGTLVSRGSEYEINITGPVVIVINGATLDPADYGYTVYYSTDEPSTTSASDNMNATWVTEDDISDWSAVTMIKIVMDDGTTISAGDSVEFAVPAEIPLGAAESFSGDDLQIIAVNSFAYATTADPDADEMVGVEGVIIPMTRAFISGNVFDDFNYDGIREADSLDDSDGYDERGLSDVTVSVYDTDGTLISQTTTDEDGNYEIAVSSGDSVTVVFTAPDGYEFASTTVDTSTLFPTYEITSDYATDSDGDTISNDVDSTGSGTVTLDYEYTDSTTMKLNAGLQQTPLTSDVTKTWVGGVADSATFTLSGDDQTETLTLTSDDATSDSVWSGSFTGLRTYDPDGDAISYSLTEDAIDGYTATVSGSVTDGFSVTNTSESDSDASGTDSTTDESTADGSDSADTSEGESEEAEQVPSTGDSIGTVVLVAGTIALLGLIAILLAARRRC
jgi:LPXTG-motif cell wall-anchored protein